MLLESRNPLRQLMPRENNVFLAPGKDKEAEVRWLAGERRQHGAPWMGRTSGNGSCTPFKDTPFLGWQDVCDTMPLTTDYFIF